MHLAIVLQLLLLKTNVVSHWLAGRSRQNVSAVTKGKSLWRTKSKNKSKSKTKKNYITTRKTRTKLSTRNVCTSVSPLLTFFRTRCCFFMLSLAVRQSAALFFIEYTNSKIVIYVFRFSGGGNRRQASVFQSGFVLKQVPKKSIHDCASTTAPRRPLPTTPK